MIKAIFFDQDNTLVNTREIAGETYRKAIDWVAAQKKIDANNLYQEWRKVLDILKNSPKPEERQFGYSLGLVVPEKDLVEDAVEIQRNALAEKIGLNLGVKEFFENKIEGIKYILFTEDFDDQIEIKLSKFGLREKFDLVVGSSNVGLMKPNIKFLQIAWDKFGLDSKDCLYIGDNYDKDCKLGIDNGGKGLVFGKDLTDFRELAEKLKNLN
jgi:HAD superfamily hydrolase (TIGR01549 family)